MQPYDLKKEHRALYAPRADGFQVIDVPRICFLMIDGHGDPNTTSAYRQAVETLFAASYAARAVARSRLDRVHTVAPLEGLWWAQDLGAFRARTKSLWHWTMMIAQPDWITPDVLDEALAAVDTRRVPALDQLRHQQLTEGPSVQILHVGPYDDEGPVLARLHEDYLPRHRLAPSGHHHEVYLSDPRRTDPARLRTILRQPVAPVV